MCCFSLYLRCRGRWRPQGSLPPTKSFDELPKSEKKRTILSNRLTSRKECSLMYDSASLQDPARLASLPLLERLLVEALPPDPRSDAAAPRGRGRPPTL